MAIVSVLAWIVIQATTPTVADWSWLDQFREAAFEKLMPINPASKPSVVYRSHRDLYQDVLERYFSLSFGNGPGFDRNRLTATVVVPVGRSIQQQLLESHMRDRQAQLESLVSQVVVRRVSLSAERCPAIRTRLDALSKVVISLPERDAIFLYPFVHRIVIDLGGTHIDATVFDPDNPIIRWATETTDAILACATGYQAVGADR
jgi:hypothetical protein